LVVPKMFYKRNHRTCKLYTKQEKIKNITTPIYAP
jgi:hypothetical protein